MAQLAGARHTYMDTVRREDLLDMIADVSPDANPLTTMLKTTTASQTLHEWSEYYEARPTSNSKSVEGDDNTFTDLSQPTKYNNITQIIKEVFAVSDTDIAVDKVSPKDAYAQEEARAMRRWKNKLEYAVLRGTKASGSSGVAREMGGLISFVVANGKYTARNSGTSFSETEFSNMVNDSWDITDSNLIDLMLMGGNRVRDMKNFFTSAAPRTIAATDNRFVQTVSVVDTDFGTELEIKAHKDMPAGGVLGIRKELAKIAYLRNPKHVPNGVTGDNQKGHIVGEATLEVSSAKPFTYRSGLNL